MNRWKGIFVSIFILSAFAGYGQTRPDTVQKLKEVVVRAYLSEQPILRLPSSVSVVDSRQIRNQPGTSLLPALNTVPGLRMEERSPGSYRLSIRGSLLRSPFGIRNIKIYMDDFPLTDAGGNTYLNSVDAGSVNSLEVLKGPDGSLFGANSGGVILINPHDRRADSAGMEASISGGSFNSLQQNLKVQQNFGKHFLQINQAYQTSEGYRDHSDLNRLYGQVRYNWDYSESSQLRLLGFYSDLDYKTPGGLTLVQFNENARAARPATAVSPGAVEQQAAIFNKTLFGGLLNESKVFNRLRHVLAVFGSHTDFKNPFITNYEVRDENTGGLRTYVEWTARPSKTFTWKANAGLEWQQTNTSIRNYDNNTGQKGTIQSSDDLSARQYFYFTRFTATMFNRLDFEIAASVIHYRYEFNTLSSEFLNHRNFEPKIMPRVALSYQVSDNVAWRSSVSKGYSPPTVPEIRASDQRINTSLQPESGWNYETGIRLRNNNDRFWLDASIFHYQLEDAIVQRVNADDTEYFLNAGGTRQLGFESQISAWLKSPSRDGFIRGVQFRNSLTFNNFKFRNYESGAVDFSGNRLTGVPDQIVVSSADVTLPASFTVYLQHNYTSKIPLNDVNNSFSDSYNLIQLKGKWQNRLNASSIIELFAGIDNLLNEKYSLGNDLNAFGGRYYNAAPRRNFFAGIKANL